MKCRIGFHNYKTVNEEGKWTHHVCVECGKLKIIEVSKPGYQPKVLSRVNKLTVFNTLEEINGWVDNRPIYVKDINKIGVVVKGIFVDIFDGKPVDKIAEIFKNTSPEFYLLPRKRNTMKVVNNSTGEESMTTIKESKQKVISIVYDGIHFDDFIKSTKKCNYSDDLVNVITRELDKNISNDDLGFVTYMYPQPFNNRYLLRYPGATRGNIEVDDNNRIVSISIYEDTNLYGADIEKKLNKFIGKIMVF